MMLVSTSEIQYRSHTLTYLNGPILCINHLPSHTAALYYHGDKNALGLAIMMICDVSSQQFRFEALLVPEQIGNTEWRVGMRTGGEGGGTRSWFVTCCWLLWRQMISSAPRWSPWDIEMDGVEMECGWLVTSLHSARHSNVTGGDRHHLRSPSFNPNDKGGGHSFPHSL